MNALPEWVEPMAATLTQERFATPAWCFERKLDGIRLLAFKDRAGVRLLSRNRLPQNAAYPSVVQAMAGLAPSEVILDGEATGVWGHRGAVAYHVFDVLWLDRRDVTLLPLDERRALLEGIRLPPPSVGASCILASSSTMLAAGSARKVHWPGDGCTRNAQGRALSQPPECLG